MEFANELRIKKNERILKFASEFVEKIKPKLVESAEKGYSAYIYKIDKNNESEKEKLQIYSDPVFIERLNYELDGVKVEYKNEFVENQILSGFGFWTHKLIFRWV